MNAVNSRKYEITFLVATSLLITLVNNLPYYSLFFFSATDYKQPSLSTLEIVYNITWYTLQCLLSILLISFFNYYWKKHLIPKKSAPLGIILLTAIYNVAIAFILFKASMYLASLTVGYPFSEDFAFRYYVWKYINLTPLGILMSYVLELIVRKRVVELNNAKLIEENLSIQLKTLQDQVKPHFLFNTLNTLSAVIRNENKEEGLKYVDDLAIVYRYILEKSHEDLVALSLELDFANSYIRLLKKRFHKKFEYKISIPKTYLSYQIPPLTIQLLIENAIKHNELSNVSPVNINIYVDHHHIFIENNIQPKTAYSGGLGIGLQNLNQRYKILIKEEIVINRLQNKFIVCLPLLEK